MYLAATQTYDATVYSIRISIYDEECAYWLPKEIFNLGPRPQRYISEDAIGAITFSETLQQAVSLYISKDPDTILEELLFDFFSPPCQQFLKKYPTRKQYTVSPLTPKEREQIKDQLDTFDIRRLYFLRYGAVDQRHLHKVHKKLCRPLLNTSRDEKEHYFTGQEQSLPPEERKSYVFAIFDLQRHFSQSFAPFMPEGLPELEIEEAFLNELCALNSKKKFIQGPMDTACLHHHLRRYLLLFFDNSFIRPSFTQDFIRQFMGNNRSFKWPEQTVQVETNEIESLFDASMETLKKMKKDELNRLYRKKAKELHPDKGGDHQQFIKLTEAYNYLKGKK